MGIWCKTAVQRLISAKFTHMTVKRNRILVLDKKCKLSPGWMWVIRITDYKIIMSYIWVEHQTLLSSLNRKKEVQYIYCGVINTSVSNDKTKIMKNVSVNILQDSLNNIDDQYFFVLFWSSLLWTLNPVLKPLL